MSPEFRYGRLPGDVGDNYFLMYVVEPPFGRQHYDSARKTWLGVD